MSLGNKYKILLLVAVVLAVYYPALFGDVNSVDDVYILDYYGLNSTLTLKDVLVPGGGYYYRPLIGLSYFFDNVFWNMEKSFMHLENILLHVANTLLVFLAAGRIGKKIDVTAPGFPFFAALIFALHPVNTEAVSWIAGRTDPLAALFVFLSLNLLLKGLDENRTRYVYLSAASLFLGALAKEVALFFIPGAICIVFFWNNFKPGVSSADCRLRRQTVIAMIGVPLAVCSLFLSHFFLKNGANSMARFFDGTGAGSIETLITVAKAFGFYIKKIIVPQPLNFAIAAVDDRYVWVGLVAVAGLIWCLLKRRAVSALLMCATFLLLPALLVAVVRIAWTPIAERYLYVPSAFFALAAAVVLYRFSERMNKPLFATVLSSFLLVSFAHASVSRNFLWQDNLRLYEDTVQKSLRFSDIRNEYAVALFKAGRKTDAISQLQTGMGLPGRAAIKVVMEANLLRFQVDGKSPDDASKIAREKITDYSAASADLLMVLKGIEENRLYAAPPEAQAPISREVIAVNEALYLKTHNFHLLYRNGLLYQRLGDKETAAALFKKAYEGAPQHSPYKVHARTLHEQLIKP